MRVEQEQLKAFLLDGALVDKQALLDAENEAQKGNLKLEDVLVERKLLKEEELIKLKGYILGIPYVNLDKERISLDILQIIPEAIAKEHNIVAYKKTAHGLEVAMADPEDLQIIDFIKKKSDLVILPRLTTKSSIQNVLKQYQKSLKAEFGDIMKKDSPKVAGQPTEVSAEELIKISQDLPVIRIVDALIKHAILQHASDIHVEPMEKEVIVRYRVDGLLHDAMVLPIQIHPAIIARIKVAANLKIDEHRLPQDGRFKTEQGDMKISIRVSILPVYDGEKIVMRLLFEDAEGYTLEGLGLRGQTLESVHRQIKKPHGMILVTGPTGSGKTTTLYTIMEILNTPGVNISTIEDPIEYRMPRINQTQVQAKVGLTFANGLRALVRQDPDIIMVGEIRDNETADLAVNAALTGHLVLSTLHTNSAAGALPRLLDMKVEPFLIASTTNVIVAQRLVRRLCAESREKYRLSKAEIEGLNKTTDLEIILKNLKAGRFVTPDATWETINFYRPGNSPDCVDGFKGRIGIYEVLTITDKMKELIEKQAPEGVVNEEAKKEGMISMLEDGFIKAVQGITTIEEVLAATQE